MNGSLVALYMKVESIPFRQQACRKTQSLLLDQDLLLLVAVVAEAVVAVAMAESVVAMEEAVMPFPFRTGFITCLI